MIQALAIVNSTGAGNRLMKKEVELCFEFVYSIHDHSASTPAKPLYWERVESVRTQA